jgi:hypothetical protein
VLFWGGGLRADGVCVASISRIHPAIDASLAAGKAPPAGHPSLQSMFASLLPSSHPNVDQLVAAGTPLPVGHVSLDSLACRSNSTTYTSTVCYEDLSIYADHPSVDNALAKGQTLPDRHPSVHSLFAAYLPSTHQNVDMLLKVLPFFFHLPWSFFFSL